MPASHPHPSELLLEYLTPLIIDKQIGVLPITAETAVTFERLFGRSAHFWLNLQASYDRYTAEQGNAILAEHADNL